MDKIEIIKKLMLNKISREEFLRLNNLNEKDVSKYIEKNIEEACEIKNADYLDYFMYIGFVFDVFSEKNIKMLCKLIIQDWHKKHEDIALLLEEFKSPLSIKYLYDTAIAKFEYLDFDDNYALAVKCIWALGEINTMESKKALEELAVSENEIIKKSAKEQLNMRNFDRAI